MLKNKIFNFLSKTGKSYSCKSAAKVLRINEETTRKYLREMYYTGDVTRTRVGKAHRYSV